MAVEGVTTTDLTGTLDTVMVAIALLPSLVAVIVAVPAPTPLTSPLASTLATPVAPDDQATVRPASGLPLASFGVAVSCTIPPTSTAAAGGVTATDATGRLITVIAAVSASPPRVRVAITL